MTFDVRRLELLRDLAQLDTVTAVAEVHRVTASAVSQQLRVLEEEAGTALLVRTGRNVRLTPAGRLLVEHTGDVLEALERARGALAALGEDVAGRVTLGAYPSVLASVGGAVVLAATGRHPALDVRLRETDATRAVPEVVRGDLDYALVLRYPESTELGEPRVRVRRLFDERFVAVVPRESGPEVAVQGLVALRRRPWVLGAGDLPCTRSILATCRAAGFEPDVHHAGVGYHAAVRLVGIGLGVAVVPELSARELPPGVVAVPCEVPAREVALVHRDGAHLHPVTRAVVVAAESVRDVVRAPA